ncbi:glycosyltransferase [Mannheimia sp. E30BD]|uniref:glycosyltransferase n=1 Tax=Mannheimia sp. E30BD TaxID=3278708 RepID=UPI00359F0977
MKLSIVIPVYNVEKYLCACLSSILRQNLTDCEVIIINDGSTDNSAIIAEKFCSEYQNFHLYYKENGGLSSARNFGLEKAIGEYIYFLDSDDYLEDDALSIIIDEMEKYDLDGIAFDFRKVTEQGKVINKKNYYQDIGIVSGNEFLDTFTCISNVWSYLYKKDILIKNQLNFLEGIYHEDELFTPQAISYCKRFKFINVIAYNYLQRSGSIMTTINKEQELKKFNSKIIVLEKLMEFSKVQKKIQSIDYHPVDKKIEDLVISLRVQYYRNDGIERKYKLRELNAILPPNFLIRYANIRKRIFWLIDSIIRKK